MNSNIACFFCRCVLNWAGKFGGHQTDNEFHGDGHQLQDSCDVGFGHLLGVNFCGVLYWAHVAAICMPHGASWGPLTAFL